MSDFLGAIGGSVSRAADDVLDAAHATASTGGGGTTEVRDSFETCHVSNEAAMSQHRHALAAGQIEITQRAFISDDMFAIFDGDHRGVSACLSAHSRVNQYAVVDLKQGTLVDHHEWSDQTQMYGGPVAYGEPTGSEQLKRYGDAFVLTQQVTGSDPLVPGAPAVDMKGMYGMKLDDQGVVHVWMGMRSETFPSHEVVLRDPSNQTLLLWGENEEKSSVDALTALRLAGTGTVLGTAHVEIQTDANGDFVKVRHPRGEWMSIDDWNREAAARAAE